MKRIFTFLISLALVALAGCASSLKQLPDGNYFGITTVMDSLDRSASRIGHYKVVGKNADGSPKLEEIRGDISAGPTVAGQALIGASGGVLSAYVQGEKAKDVAKITSTCGGGGCSSGTPVVVNAISQSASNTHVESNVSVGGSAPCGIGTCGN